MKSLHILLLALVWTCSAATAPAAPQNGAFARLENELLRWKPEKQPLEPARFEVLLKAVEQCGELLAKGTQHIDRYEAIAFNISGPLLASASGRDGGSLEGQLVDVALGTLRVHLPRERANQLACEVLPLASTPIGTRRAVARLFRIKPPPDAKLALVLGTHDADATLALLCLESLVGWNDDLVHAVFLDAIEAGADARRGPKLELAAEHWGAVHCAAGDKVARRLVDASQRRLQASDSGEAVRAADWTRALADSDGVPLLISALESWSKRPQANTGARPVREALARRLEERFGTALGFEAGPWRAWWQDVVAGKRPPLASAGPRGTSKPSFFGVRALTDRVVFVLDSSGSMSSPFELKPHGATGTGHGAGPGSGSGGSGGRASGGKGGTGGGAQPPPYAGPTRWDEAKKQLFAFLATAPRGMKFDVVLFHSGAESFRGRLVECNETSIAELRTWIDGHQPGGGTSLRAGIDRALGLANGQLQPRTGVPDECKELVLLCDGQTDEGPEWVPQFVAEVVPKRGIVVHGVQVGGHSDGALEALAKGAMGTFVKVGD